MKSRGPLVVLLAQVAIITALHVQKSFSKKQQDTQIARNGLSVNTGGSSYAYTSAAARYRHAQTTVGE
jgi:hypothetical protein